MEWSERVARYFAFMIWFRSNFTEFVHQLDLVSLRFGEDKEEPEHRFVRDRVVPTDALRVLEECRYVRQVWRG